MIEVAKGHFYLGEEVDPATSERLGAEKIVEYDARDLTTHGVIVGMTGSGKTGLGVVLLEEAMLSGVPALILDPKGDMGNLLLTFPELRPDDFAPWVNEGDARRKEQTVEEFAAGTAELWRNGLDDWGQGPDRIRKLQAAAPITVFTPGSEAGVPLNIVGSLEVPDLDWSSDAEVLRDEIEGFVSSLLNLAGIESDPVSSREHILLANLIEKSWSEGRSMDLASLIAQVQDPPLRKLGVFEVDAFFPQKDRTALAMRLNGLVASPSFASWLAGPPLDVQSMLYTPDGDPKAAIVYLAHLSEEERQFIVTLILSKVVTWMRSKSGTTDLRALIYMDEVFGFVPPTAAPPSKKPILTILKQARAFGVGMVLSTQNPVDLDYKAMSNAGTWCVGRLQTERDKSRILEALQSAAGGIDVDHVDAMVSGLGKRQFLLHNTHEKEPRVFQTRWAMSYLRGPLTREQIADLTGDDPSRTPAAPEPAPAARATEVEPALADNESPVAPEVADGVPVYYLDPAAPWASDVGAAPGGARFRPGLAARVDLLFDDSRAGVSHTEEWEAVFFPLEDEFDPESAKAVDYDKRDFRAEPPGEPVYVLPEAPIGTKTFFSRAATKLKEHLYRNRDVQVFRNPELKLYSRVGESRDEFLARCDEAAQEMADAETAKIRDRLESRMDRVRDQLEAAHRRMEELEVDVDERKRQELLSGAGDVLNVLLGGRRSTRGISRAASRRSTTRRTQQRLATAQAKVDDKLAELEELEDEIVDEIAEINDKWEEAAAAIEQVDIGLEKTDIAVDQMALLWVPVD